MNAPSSLTAVATNSAKVTVSWVDNSTNEGGFKVEIATGAGGFTLLKTFGPNVTSFVDTRTQNDYSYRVKAYRSTSNSDYSNTATVSVIAAPTGLNGSVVGSDVTLNWTDNATNEAGFKIERSDNGGAFAEIATVAANVTTYPDSGLSGGQYKYQVRAYATNSNSDYTSQVTVNVVNAPSGMTAVGTGTTAFVAWTDNSTNEDGFKVEIATNAGAFVLFKTLGPNVSSTSATSLAQNAYTFRVRAYKGTSFSNYSNSATATILRAPNNFVVTVAGVDATLNWTDFAVGEDGYTIERSFNGGAFAQIDTVGANVQTYFDPGLAGGAYSYRIKAYTNAGDTSFTTTSTVVNVVVAPSSLTAVATGSAVALNWVDNSTNETGFKIERSTGGSFTQIATVSANITTYNDASVSAGSTYTYQVRAYKSSANSNYSNTDDATVLDTPTSLGTSVVGSDVTLNWTDNATGEDGYRIERSDNGGGYIEIGTVGTDVSTYDDLGLATGSYDYRVRAYKGTDTSDYSSTANAIIP